MTQIQKSELVLQNGDPIYNVRIKILSKILDQKSNNQFNKNHKVEYKQ